MGTFQAESIYGNGGNTQVNPARGAAKVHNATPGDPKSGAWGDVPILPGVAGSLGIPVPMLVAMGVFAWWLFRQY